MKQFLIFFALLPFMANSQSNLNDLKPGFKIKGQTADYGDGSKIKPFAIEFIKYDIKEKDEEEAIKDTLLFFHYSAEFKTAEGTNKITKCPMLLYPKTLKTGQGFTTLIYGEEDKNFDEIAAKDFDEESLPYFILSNSMFKELNNKKSASYLDDYNKKCQWTKVKNDVLNIKINGAMKKIKSILVEEKDPDGFWSTNYWFLDNDKFPLLLVKEQVIGSKKDTHFLIDEITY